MKIGYDVDGTILESAPWFIMHLMKYYTWSNGLRKYDEQGYELFYFADPDNFDGDWSKLNRRIAEGITLWQNEMSPVQGAIPAMQLLKMVTTKDPVLITVRDDSTLPGLRRWLNKFYGAYGPVSIIKVDNHEDKITACRDLGITHYVEDRYWTAHHLAENGIKVCLLDKVYNNRPTGYNVQRCRDWTEVTESMVREWNLC